MRAVERTNPWPNTVSVAPGCNARDGCSLWITGCSYTSRFNAPYDLGPVASESSTISAPACCPGRLHLKCDEDSTFTPQTIPPALQPSMSSPNPTPYTLTSAARPAVIMHGQSDTTLAPAPYALSPFAPLSRLDPDSPAALLTTRARVTDVAENSPPP